MAHFAMDKVETVIKDSRSFLYVFVLKSHSFYKCLYEFHCKKTCTNFFFSSWLYENMTNYWPILHDHTVFVISLKKIASSNGDDTKCGRC